jgi:hypothetical protein
MLCAPADKAVKTSMALVNMAGIFIFILFVINQCVSKMFNINAIC